jgi:hypothetical protein
MAIFVTKKLHIAYSIPCIAVSILLLLLHSAIASEIDPSDPPKQDVKLIWAENYGQGEQIYFSSYENNTWQSPLQLSNSLELVFHASVSSGTDGKIWAVWTSKEKEVSFLEWSVSDSSKWSKPRRIYNGLDTNKAATIIVDTNNIPWLAWAGVQNKYPDIFWSRWNGKGWDPPVKAHEDNKVPDLAPKLILDGIGRIVLSWQTFANGQYVTVYKVWDGYKWQQEPDLLTMKKSMSTFSKSKRFPDIPNFIKDTGKATYFIKETYGAGSIPLSDF